MKVAGLFTRQAARKSVTKKQGITAETLKRLGVDAVAAMNPKAKNVNMKPTGSDEPLVYVLGECPSESDDLENDHFTDKAGEILRSNLPSNYTENTRFNNCVNTLPPSGRLPTEVEIEAFRKVVEEDIAVTKPRLIIGLGMVPFTWALGRFKGLSMKTAAGRVFPIEIAGHRCFMLAVHDPKTLLQMINQGIDSRTRLKRSDNRFLTWEDAKRKKASFNYNFSKSNFREVNDQFFDQIARAWRKSIRDAYKLADSGAEPEIITVEEAKEGIECVLADPTTRGISRLEELVDEAIGTGKFALDLETNCFRAFKDGAKIVSVSIGSKKGTFAFCIDHPKQHWGPNRKKVVDLFRRLCQSDCVKICHNLPFDLEWVSVVLSDYDLLLSGSWRCTLAQAYVLDERTGGHSLQFVSTQRFGLRVKDLTDVNRKDPEREEPEKLLLYNGIDSKITLRLYSHQSKLIKAEGLEEVNKTQQDRILPAVMGQILGFAVSQKRVRRMVDGLNAEMKEALDAIQRSKHVIAYKKRYGSLNPASNDQVISLYKNIIGIKPVNEDGKLSVDESVLKSIGGNLSKLILDTRKISKKISTYLDPLDSRNKESVVYPDGMVHTSFNLTLTDTGRLSSSDPNVQNYPKRNLEARKIRRCFVALPGYGLLAADHGQLEYRVLGIISRDKVIVDSCFTNFDVHMAWAKKIAKAFPEAIQSRYGDMDEKAAYKMFRADVKNQWVFPQFYGSSFGSCAKNLGVPVDVARDLAEEFWQEFHGVKAWQKETVSRYEVDGYVACPNGRRRHGPMTYNMIINSPIQGFASDIVIDGMIRLCRMAIETKSYDLAARLNIHDDLTSMPLLERINWCAKKMVRCMLACDFSIINVPLLVELSAGKDWENMVEVGKYYSNKIEAVKSIDVMPMVAA